MTKQKRPGSPVEYWHIDEPIGGPRTPEQEAENAKVLAEIGYTYPLQPPQPPPVPTIDPPLACQQNFACPNRARLFTTDHFGTLYALCLECAQQVIKSETQPKP